MANKTEACELLGIFRNYQRQQPLDEKDAFDQAQAAILNVVQALRELVLENNILAAIGDAKSPNAVSRALRSRLSPLK
mgnify:CR=1 FL=1